MKFGSTCLILLTSLNSAACIKGGAYNDPTPPAGSERITITVQGGARMRMEEPEHKAGLAQRNWRQTDSEDMAPVLMVGARTQIDEAVSGELLITRDVAPLVERYRYDDIGYLRLDHVETSATLLASWLTGPVRWGIGGMVRYDVLTTVTGECECSGEREASFPGAGAVANISISLPETSRFFGDVRVQGRWLTRRSADAGTNRGRIGTGGPAVVVGVGIGMRSLR